MTAVLTLPALLDTGSEERASTVLRRYYAPLSGHNAGYTGGAWDTFDPNGRREADADRFTADDLVSVALLGIEVKGRAVVEILGPQADVINRHLQAIPRDLDLVELRSIDRDGLPSAWELWKTLRGLPELGPTTASKLMARKRPRLIPIFDSVIKDHLMGGGDDLWIPLHAALRADGGALHHRLLDLRARAALPEDVSVLRVLDVLTWMEGSGRA
ncbi:hypothetical protein SAMN04488543_3903 [Friedmanniella luteola]|uniref:Uncharacterized protein n=1 Tax=Friedmanniella luteola TaxID=546871 RepID=A0A1H1ZNK0_9ACTN|nr:DUF6308 family protein [Friedmanniella luteola]SDT35381.1 hypothetical protein SAMN04488543_3903 [Friedmanniella luteola]